MSSDVLKEELAYFNEKREDLLAIALGKYALVKGREIVGTFDSAENAYYEGARRFPGESILIQEILPEDTTLDNPANYLGLIHAAF